MEFLARERIILAMRATGFPYLLWVCWESFVLNSVCHRDDIVRYDSLTIVNMVFVFDKYIGKTFRSSRADGTDRCVIRLFDV